jgi:hypothetical protein
MPVPDGHRFLVEHDRATESRMRIAQIGGVHRHRQTLEINAVIVVARPWQLTKSAGRLGESETLAAGEHETESNPHLPPPQPFSSSERKRINIGHFRKDVAPAVNQEAERIPKWEISACRGRDTDRSIPPAQSRTGASTHTASALDV